MINYAPLSTASVLAALYNASRPQGMGFLAYQTKNMTEEEASILLEERGNRKYFDYLQGRVMKIDLSAPDQFEERLYDRDNGTGAAQRVIDILLQARYQDEPKDKELINQLHKQGVMDAADKASDFLNQTTKVTGTEITLGGSDVPQLAAKILDAVYENDK